VEKRFAAGASLLAAYTWSRVRDVQTPLRINNRGSVNWSSRMVSGRHEDLTAEPSLNDLPHRVVLAGSWRAPWRRWTTELAVFYVGESGSPFTYRSSGRGGLGDLNADGSNLNDPVYVPLDATDPAEIVFGGSPAEQQAQAEAFEAFILGSACLRARRGRILGRNSCREPWSHTAVITVRQRIPVGARGADLQLDLFNPLNLIDRTWGVRKISTPALLGHIGQSTVPGIGAQPVFLFDAGRSQWVSVPAESAFQVQLGIGYRF
jgi:hypothetical protein